MLANFDAVWNQLVQLCSQPGLGAAGQHCISDRQAGACKWKAASGPQYPGQPAQGACWNWFNAYRDPIANDTAPAVVAAAGAASPANAVSDAATSVASTLSSALGTSVSPDVIIGVGLLAAALLVHQIL